MNIRLAVALCSVLLVSPTLAQNATRPKGDLFGNITSKQEALSTARPASPQIRMAIVEAARNFLFDPYSIRDVQISPQVDLRVDGSYSIVCVRYNAKNRMGAYAGRTTTGIFIGDRGQILNSTDRAPGCFWPEMPYGPFPESDILKKL
ncbi:hypothetical protein [Ancylobacter rudongensis]|uniref:Uncharacterized protein n=1 Tax=Ancylobacter rudongensis TaxID=177413 RepID=A0A1G4UPB1_9HYPH|nr:hypothetical protein [Ancylobacter rudongensis]SCW95478.1 hypothetical protein SAMN05660859_0038 [Ancylobacter rudongensis]